MFKLFSITILILAISAKSYSQNDPCYDTSDSNLGLIGNCIPTESCHGVTQSGLCPSYPGDHICCFDVNKPGREVRGTWIATVQNIDWPIAPGSDVSAHQAQLRTLIDSLKDVNMNTLYFQVRPVGDAFYISSLEPWSIYLTGTPQGTPPNPMWDPLQYAIDYAKPLGMEVHAWINPYRANMVPNSAGLAPNHMARRWPQYAYAYGNHLWMDPGAAEVANFTYEICLDLVTRYDLDGLHMDDYFYPYPVNGVDFPDSATYNKYISEGGTLSRADWRRDNVNRLVEKLNTGIHTAKPWVKFSISPFGIYRPGHPEGMPSPPIIGFDQYSGLYADPKLWLQEGWVDMMQPQLYWPIDSHAQSYRTLLDWWVGINTLNRHVYAGNAIYKVSEQGWPWEEIRRQIGISRENNMRQRGSWGNILFPSKLIRDNFEGSQDAIRSIYPFPAIQPEFPWLATAAGQQTTPGKLEIVQNGGSIIIKKSVSFYSNSIVLYQLMGDDDFQVLNVTKGKTEFNLPSGNYAFTSTDRYGQESELTFVKV